MKYKEWSQATIKEKLVAANIPEGIQEFWFENYSIHTLDAAVYSDEKCEKYLIVHGGQYLILYNFAVPRRPYRLNGEWYNEEDMLKVIKLLPFL